DRDQALKYKEMSEKVNTNKATLLDLQIKKKKEDNKNLTKQIDELKSQIEKYENEIAKLKKENEDKKTEINDINKEIEEKGEKEQVEINRQVEGLKIEIAKNNSRINHLQTELVKIDQREKELIMSLQEIKSKVSGVGKQKEELEKRKKELESDKKIVDDKIKKFREKHKLDSIGDIDKEIDEIDKKIDEIQKQVFESREEQQQLIRKKDSLEYKINTIDDRIAKIKGIEKEHKDELEKIKQKREEFKKTTLQLNELLNQDSKTSSQLVQARKILLEKNEELAQLRMKENAVKHSINSDIAVKRILELKERKRGIYNTVSELGNASAEYAQALEVAAGQRIKSIVVEDDAVAAECIKYLRNNKLGIARFLPLNKIKTNEPDQNARKILNHKGIVGFASDLIEYDLKFKNIFSYVFGNCLIVNDLNTAREVGIGKVKMVTLNGDLCDVSGAMQGGFRQKKKDGMSFRDDNVSKQVKKAEGESAEISAEISSLESKKSGLEDEILNLRKFKAELEGDIIKSERALHISDDDMDSGMNDKKEFEKEMKELEKNERELQSKISKTNSELAQYKIKRQQLKEKVMQLRSPTLIAELNTFEQKRGEITEEMIKVESELKSASSQMDSMFSTERNNIDKLIKQLEKEKVDFNEEIKELEKGNSIKNKELKQKEDEAKKFYAQFKDLFNKRTVISNDINSNDVKINGKQQKSREHEIKLNTISLNNAKTSAELAGLEEEFKQYHNVPLLKESDEEQLKREIYRFEKMREEMGNVNMKALEMYENIEKEYNSLTEKKDTLDKERMDVVKLIEEIDKNKKELFMTNFETINKNFQDIFAELSTKGQAFLEVENPEDPFAEGVQIKVRITGNKFMDIKSLSGGEKTMTALAFIFAIQEHDPAEFYIMDEVDAALDKKNSERLADLILKYSKKAQYIVISHNDGIIKKADTLYGISMDEHNISKATSLKI
ncbi:MAG: hypothetical protein ACMXX5_01955, partial [Candidatus Woesearchaeota archaeon]